MLVINRFQDPGPGFAERAAEGVDFWRQREGCVSMELVRNLDDDGLWAIVSRWVNVGAYRRSFGGYEAKMILTPLLSLSVDEPSAYLSPEDAADNVPRSMG